MRWGFQLTSLALAAFALSVNVAPGGGKVDADRIAKESAQRCLTAMKAKSLDDIMAAIDVPFVITGPCSGVIKDRKQLRQVMSGLVEQGWYRDGMDVKTVRSVDERWAELTESGKGEFKGLLGPKDRIATVVSKSGDRVHLFIRIRDGKAKVVGFGG